MTQTNINYNSTGIYGNTGNVFQNIEPGIPVAVALVPKGTVIPATAFISQSAFLTYITASAHGFLADARKNRYFLFQNLDDFKDVTKTMNNVDTGLNQFETTKFNTKYTFRVLTNKANHREMLSFDNAQNLYDTYVWDKLTNVWGQADPTLGGGGMGALTLNQLRIMDWSPADVKDFNKYTFSIQFKNRVEFNENFAIWNTGIDADNIAGLMNAVMNDVSATLGTPLTITTTTDVVCVMKAGNGSIDLAQYYQGVVTKACFVAKNLTLGTTLTISTLNQGTIVVAGQVYNYLWFILSAAPTATNVVQIALAAPSVVNPIVANFNAVTEIVAVGVDGQNAAVHTF